MEGTVFEGQNPPPGSEIYVFPYTIPAYNLRNKKWGKLPIPPSWVMFRDLSNTTQMILK
jgi:hypothetical protein